MVQQIHNRVSKLLKMLFDTPEDISIRLLLASAGNGVIFFAKKMKGNYESTGYNVCCTC